MKKARILTKSEFKRVLAVIDSNKYSERNRAVLYLSFYAGLHACGIASLRLHDVVDDERKVKSQFVLDRNCLPESKDDLLVRWVFSRNKGPGLANLFRAYY